MSDHTTLLPNVTQPQLPPTAAERAARRKNPVGKLFRDKALASRRGFRESLEKMRLVELSGDPGADSQ